MLEPVLNKKMAGIDPALAKLGTAMLDFAPLYFGGLCYDELGTNFSLAYQNPEKNSRGGWK